MKSAQVGNSNQGWIYLLCSVVPPIQNLLLSIAAVSYVFRVCSNSAPASDAPVKSLDEVKGTDVVAHEYFRQVEENLRGHLEATKKRTEWCVAEVQKLGSRDDEQVKKIEQLLERVGEQDKRSARDEQERKIAEEKNTKMLPRIMQCYSSWIRDSRPWSGSLLKRCHLVSRLV